MAIGGQAAGQWHDEHVADGDQQAAPAPPPSEWDFSEDQQSRRRPSRSGRFAGLLLGLLALCWIGGITYRILFEGPALTPDLVQFVSLMAMVSGPLALAAIAWLLAGPTSRREGRRYLETAAIMRADAVRLEEIMQALSQRIGETSLQLAQQIALLEKQGASSVDRMAEINAQTHENVTTIARHSMMLGASASSAREEMTRFLTDLPQAETRLTKLASMMAGVGDGLGNRAEALQNHIAALIVRSREADESAGGAAQRLASHLARIEGTTQTAAERLEGATVQMGRSIEQVLEQASSAVDASRRGMDVQGSAMIAMIEQGRAALDRAGIESLQTLARRIEEIGTRVDTIAGQIAAQGESSASLILQLDTGLTEAEKRFSALSEVGAERTADVAEAIVALTEHAERLTETLSESAKATEGMVDKAEMLRASFDACGREVHSGLPLALAQIEEQLLHSQTTIRAVLPDAERLEHAASTAAEKVAQAGFSIADHGNALSALGELAGTQFAQIREESEELRRLVIAAQESVQTLTSGAAPQLVEALQRVREAAVQATERARNTLGAIIPDAAQQLSVASAEAIEKAVTQPVEEQIGQIAMAAERAVQSAQGASERLMRQMLTISETTAAIEERITEARSQIERNDADNFSRRVALLMEALNSTAIDVAKLLSNEVTDSAWAAYLRGDRGVFTRRAVKLLDAGEARDIARSYEDDSEFRDQVNRYIHDFEAMLRRILATRDGNVLGVTLLSSDMGKLYVALAQAIERLRS